MAITKSPGTQNWTETHFWIRLGGLAGFLIGTVGIVLAAVGFLKLGIALAVLGGIAAAAVLVVEIQTLQEGVASRRQAAGVSVGIQVLLATFLVIEVNAFSFFHYHRFDWTWDNRFTIQDASLRDELRELRGETTILVHLTHTFGQLSDKRDEYDYAAERVVIDKVEDMVEQFREFGPQFRVFVLDRKDKRYHNKVKEWTHDFPDLADAINGTTEDSIFVLSHDKVQRIGFQEIFQLDKKASEQDNDNRGNLVLHFQGIEPFARKILDLDKRKPRIAIAVIHEELSTEGKREELGMAGVRKALTSRGFECEDIILKKWSEMGGPEPAVLTYDETKYEDLEDKLVVADQTIKALEGDIKKLKKMLVRWQESSLKKLTKDFAGQLEVKEVTEPIRQAIIERDLKPRITILEIELRGERSDRNATRRQQQKLNVNDLVEQRRISDLKAKLERKLARCDMLILPRLTILNAARGMMIPNRVYQLDRSQVDAIKNFIQKGKPALACLGPSTDRESMPQDFMHGRSDGLEEAFGELGLHFGKTTILCRSEMKSYAERRGALLILGVQAEPPPAKFEWVPGGRKGLSPLSIFRKRDPNPIAESMRLTVAGLDEQQELDLRIRDPRPVSFEPLSGKKGTVDPVFLMTDPTAWEEANPFPSGGKVPRPPNNETSQLPIGAAAEVSLPAHWGAGSGKVRLAGIGHGGVFTGNRLSPVREKLLLDTCNWLLGRDDLLARANEEPWKFPRLAMSDDATKLWVVTCWIGLPLFFAVLGVAVLLKRSMR